MRGQLYRGHAKATALSRSPLVSTLGSESDDPGSSPGRGKALCPWGVREKKMRAPLLGLAKPIYYSVTWNQRKKRGRANYTKGKRHKERLRTPCKYVQVFPPRRGKTKVKKRRLVSNRHLIGWKDGASFLDQSRTEVKRTQNNQGSCSTLNQKVFFSVIKCLHFISVNMRLDKDEKRFCKEGLW